MINIKNLIKSKCIKCNLLFNAEHYKIGMKVNCPLCNEKTEITVNTHSQNSGYEITFNEFKRALINVNERDQILPLIEEWYSNKMSFDGEQIIFINKKVEGLKDSIEEIHLRIQSKKDYQYTIYQKLMNIWR
jgi:hypothetical protein